MNEKIYLKKWMKEELIRLVRSSYEEALEYDQEVEDGIEHDLLKEEEREFINAIKSLKTK